MDQVFYGNISVGLEFVGILSNLNPVSSPDKSQVLIQPDDDLLAVQLLPTYRW